MRISDDRIADRPLLKLRHQQDRQRGQAAEDMVVNNGLVQQAERKVIVYTSNLCRKRMILTKRISSQSKRDSFNPGVRTRSSCRY